MKEAEEAGIKIISLWINTGDMKQILCTFILSFAALVTSAQTVSNKRMPLVDGDRTGYFPLR